MKLKLDFVPASSEFKIHFGDKIFLIGSCFSQNIGELLIQNKFNCLHNPFGTIYNPLSIFKLIKGDLNRSDMVVSDGIYYHWDAHGDISDLNKDIVYNQIESKNETVQQFLKNCEWIVITLGTSWVYRYRLTNNIVANCHKVPQKEFTKELLSVDQIKQEYAVLAKQLSQINPNIKIIYTVSPVRHIRDGLIENNRSKAILLQAIHELTETYTNTCYFPAYEIMMDELRDYRFYSSDLIHPSAEAIDYIWERFCETYLEMETMSIVHQLKKIRMAMEHKSFHPTSEAHQRFLKETINKVEQLHSKVDLNKELASLKSQLL